MVIARRGKHRLIGKLYKDTYFVLRTSMIYGGAGRRYGAYVV